MNAIVRQLNTSLLTARGRRRLTGHALVVALVMALLLIPSTCAQMAGPHSIFVDPTSGQVHDHDTESEAAIGFASNEELAWHVVNGDGSPGWMLDDTGSEVDDCPTRPRLHDLPSTMAMDAISAPMTLEIARVLTLPTADEPVALDAPALHAVALQSESPPPR